ncbi:MAG: hypothetical protein IH942_08995, partial [Acidobacteria bacterium]|nr:hypothetical protein [Acidobacteriota bacterium]
MAIDLERQLAGYGEQLETYVAPLSIDELVGEVPYEPRPATRRLPRWAIALAAAAVVLLVIGGPLVAIRLLSGEVVDEPISTTIPGPPEETSGQSISVVHGEGVAGAGLSMVLDSAGNPVLAYGSAGSIWVARCDDATCSSGVDRVELVPNTQLANRNPISVALFDDDTAAISYVEFGPPAPANQPLITVLKYARSGEVTTIEEGNTTGTNGGRGMVIAGNGLPVLAYYTWTGERGEVVILACGDAACILGNTRTVLDIATGFSGLDLTVDASGNPVLVYGMWEGENSLRLARCADPTCASGVAITTLSEEFTNAPSLVLDSSDRPMVLAQGEPDATEDDSQPALTRLIACRDAMCDSRTETSIPQPGEFLSSAQVVLGPDDVPLLSWVLEGELWIAVCSDQVCTDPAVNSLGIAASERQSTVVGADGRPIIAFGTGSDVALLRCADPGCTRPTSESAAPSEVNIGGEHWSVTTVVVAGVGTWPPVDISFDAVGAPLIVYPVDVGELGPEGEIDFAIGLARCSDPGCVESTLITGSGLEFFEASAALPADGLPVFAWDAIYTTEEEAVAVSKCADPDCAQAETNRIGPASMWFAPVITLAADGLPVLLYQDLSEEGSPVKVATCADPACVESVVTALDVPGFFAGPFSPALDPDGLLAVAYPVANGEFRLARCADPACSQVTVSVFDDTGTEDEGPAKLVFGANGLPVIAYSPANQFQIAVCHDSACSQATVTLLGAHAAGGVRSLMVGPDGNPIIAYRADGTAWLAVCEAATCEQFRIASLQGISGDGLMSVTGGADGLPLFVYQTESQPVGDPEIGETTGNLVVAKRDFH